MTADSRGADPNVHSSRLPNITVVTQLVSPYQVELFDEVARQAECDLFVIYLAGTLKDRKWARPVPHHPHWVLTDDPNGRHQAVQKVEQADLVIIGYYTHPFALSLLYRRAVSGRPWVFWGERPGFHRLGLIGQLFRSLFLFPLHRSQTPIWAIGAFAEEGYRKEFGDRRSYFNVPYASDLARYLGLNRTKASGVRFLFSGALIPRKGVVTLAEAFSRLASEFPDACLTVMGEGPQVHLLRTILGSIEDRVRWLGFVDWADLPSGYVDADVLCVPSTYDGWGMVVLEGLASGLPVISTPVVGAALEVVKEGETGWLVRPGDSDALLDAMRRACKLGPARLAEMGRAGRETARLYDASAGARRFTGAASLTLHREFHVDPLSRAAVPAFRVLLVGNYLPDRQPSMQRYARLLVQALAQQGISAELLYPPAIIGGDGWFGRWRGFADKFALFALYLKKLAHQLGDGYTPVVVHVLDQGNGPYIPLVANLPHLVTCHDLIAVKAAMPGIQHRRRHESIYQKYNRVALGKARWIACVSEQTRHDCLVSLACEPSRTVVIPNPLDPAFLNKVGVRPQNLPNRYFLHVGNSAWYKNRLGLLRIFGEMVALKDDLPPLLLVGPELTPQEQVAVAAAGLAARVIVTTGADDDFVRAAYQWAEALIFPSLEEGFGWPILEAMAMGCTVFTSNFAPMTEVGGDVAYYIDPDRPAETAMRILEVLRTTDQTERSIAGQKRAAEFDLKTFGQRYAALYNTILADYAGSATREFAPANLELLEAR